MKKVELLDGWEYRAFKYELDISDTDKAELNRLGYGPRRFAFNWAVRTTKEAINNFNEAILGNFSLKNNNLHAIYWFGLATWAPNGGPQIRAKQT